MLSQDCRATVVRHSHDIRTSVAKISHCKFAKLSRRQVRDIRFNKLKLEAELKAYCTLPDIGSYNTELVFCHTTLELKTE